MEPPAEPKYGTRSSKRKATSVEEPDNKSQVKRTKTTDSDTPAPEDFRSAINSTSTSTSHSPKMGPTKITDHDEDKHSVLKIVKKDSLKASSSSSSSSSFKSPGNDETENVPEMLEARVKELSQTPEASVTVSARGAKAAATIGKRGRGNATGKGAMGGRGSSRGRRRGGRSGRGGRAESQPVESTDKQVLKSGRVNKQTHDGPPKAIRFRRGKEKEGDADRTALSARKATIQQTYTKIATVQRMALSVLAEKSEQMLKEDSKYHESLPEAKEVVALLQEKHESVKRKLDARQEMEREFQQKKRMYEADYQARLLKTRLEDAEENANLMAMKGFARLASGIKLNDDWDLSDGDITDLANHLKVIPSPKSIEDQIREYQENLAIETDVKKEKSRVPANKGKGRIGRLQKPADDESELDQTRVQAPVARRRASLYQPENAPAVQTSTDDPVTIRPPVLTSAETSNPDEESSDDPSGLEDAAVQHVVQQKAGIDKDTFDSHGVHLKDNRGRNGYDPPNNRFMVKKWYDYEPHEIGNSGQLWKVVPKTKSRRMESIKDKTLTTHLHFDRVAAGYDATQNQPGDLDEKWVELTGVHPIYGIPIPDCRNEDPGIHRTWHGRLRPTHPVEVFDNDSDCPLLFRDRVSTSRSVPYLAEEDRFDSNEFLERIHMSETMQALNQRDALKSRIIAPDLLAAAASALKEPPMRSTSRAPPKRRGYDPVRDITHPRDPSPTSVSTPMYPRPPEDTTALSILADVACAVPPSFPPPMPPVAFYPPPAPLHPSHLAGYREILPAPPRTSDGGSTTGRGARGRGIGRGPIPPAPRGFY